MATTISSLAFAARMSRISVSATAAMMMEAERLRAQGQSVVDFSVGEPDFPTPEHIKQAAIEALNQNFTKYTATGGIAPLKQAIADFHRREFGSDYAPGEVLVTVGGKHALFNAISAVVDHGDEVLLPAPYWVSFVDQVTYAGGKPVILETAEAEGFAPTLAMIRAQLTPRTKLIIINSPSNPSGAVVPAETFRGILDLCRERGLWLLTDECYCKFVYEGAPYSVASEPGSKDRLIVAGSLSKTYAMTGWRLGFALAPAALVKQMLNLQSHSTSNPTSFVQKAGIAALNGPQEPVAAMLEEYRRRRRVVVDGLRAIPGVRCLEPAGAFYAYPNIGSFLGKGGIGNTFDFAQKLLQQEGVVTVPGQAFGTEQHIRISYATSIAQIQEGLTRLSRFVGGLK